MTTKEKVLALFENNRGRYFSGERIAEALSLSRTSVWKAVKALQSEGYPINAVTNRGYSLSKNTDILSAQGIQKYLRGGAGELEIEVLPRATSTNALAREKAADGAPEGLLIVSNEQTAGRGRLGRDFFSPRDTGFYMSLLLRPRNYSPQQALKITTMAAVAMCQAIEAVCAESAQIKWVNDIYIRGKKVCGILTEGSFDMENGMMEYAILGLGVNVYPPDQGFPSEISSIAGSVFTGHQDDVKNQLCAEFLNRFFVLYSGGGQENYAEEYRRRNFVVGREVSVVTADGYKKALVTGIDDQCRLLVRYENGLTERFMSGEISVRL